MTQAAGSREKARRSREEFPAGKPHACCTLLAGESNRHGREDDFAGNRMGFFSSDKPAPQPGQPVAGGALPRLADAKAKLEARDVPAAVAIYNEVLASAGARPDVLVAISGELGVRGHVRELIELISPHYDAQRHGPAVGLNLLQAYLAVRNLDAAQHVLDILFSLNRPDLEERLFGFSNVIAELMAGHEAAAPTAQQIAADEGATAGAGGAAPESAKISLASISKPIWFYGLETSVPHLLATPEGKVRRVAFGQVTLPGQTDALARSKEIEDDLGRFCRGLPLWFAETFAASNGYDPIAVVAISSRKHHMLFPAEWSADNIREVNDSGGKNLDYVVTFSLRNKNDDFELVARIWEVKKFRELKQFTTRWTPASADTVLKQFHEQLRLYMEWSARPAREGLAYTAPEVPTAHIQSLGATLTQFFGEKGVLAPEHVPAGTDLQLRDTQANPADPRAHLTLIAGLMRQKAAGIAPDATTLAHAQAWLATEPAQQADMAGLLIKLSK
jgi:hypothetical protein